MMMRLSPPTITSLACSPPARAEQRSAASGLRDELDAARRSAAHSQAQAAAVAARTEAGLREEMVRAERRLQGRVDELAAGLAAAHDGAEALRCDAAELASHNDQLESEVWRLKAEAEFAAGEAAGLEEAKERQAQALAQLREERAVLAARAEQLTGALEDARKELGQVQGAVAVSKAEARRLLGELTLSKAERQRVEQELAQQQEDGACDWATRGRAFQAKLAGPGHLTCAIRELPAMP
jgi:chromosome segregation ATPase